MSTKKMIETKSVRISSVKHVADYVLSVRWVSRSTTRIDLRELVYRLKGLKPLRDVRMFSTVAKGEGGHSIAWPDDLDVGADALWEMALTQAGRDDAVEFLRWRWRHGLSLTQAADALGISRRQVAYYASGKHPIPKAILLACKGWAAEQKAA